ncbi:MAG: hypothetical protein WAN05_11365 [Roseiarcus sp.]
MNFDAISPTPMFAPLTLRAIAPPSQFIHSAHRNVNAVRRPKSRRAARDFCLDKGGNVLYMFFLGILYRAWAGRRAARERLFENGRKAGLGHNRRANEKAKTKFFTPIARNPLKRLDSEK